MKTLILFTLFMTIFSISFAQWSEQSFNPLMIAGGIGEQVIPKVAIHEDGSIYISRFDNASGNYDVWLQKFDPAGYHLWDEEGVLVSDHLAMSWLTDYDLDVDSDGNAVLTFQDIRNNVNNVYAYKVSPEGDLLWTSNGITMSYDTDPTYANMSPRVLCTADGNSYLAWQRMGDTTSVYLNRLDPEGNKLWGEYGILIEIPGESVTWPQMLETTNGILVKYYRDTGPYWSPTRHLYIARYDQDGEVDWTTPISTAGGITAWTQIIDFHSDGLGGAIIAWYDDRNSDMVNEVYIQRVTSDGSISMPVNGALISTDTANQQYYPKLAVDPVNQYIFAFYKQTNSGQTQDGMNRQLIDYDGNRLWGDTGVVMIPLSSYVASPIKAYPTHMGAVIIYEVGTIPSSDMSMHIRAECYDNDGFNLWEDYLDLVTTNTPKVHVDASSHPEEWVVLSWEEDYNLYATRGNGNGTTPMFYPPPDALSALVIEFNNVELCWCFNYPSYPPETFSIYMNDELEVVVDYGITSHVFSNLDPGIYSFYIIANYPYGYDSEPSETIYVTISETSTDELVNPMETLAIWPNPIASSAHVRFYQEQPAESVQISFINIKGQTVYKSNLIVSGQSWNDYYLNLDEIGGNRIANGIYFLRLKSDDKLIQKKILILR